MTGRPSGRRTIRSFVRRTGRITPAQHRALSELWPQYGIAFSAQTLNLDEVFGRSAERVLEIGFGNGETLVHEASEKPEIDFLGVEVHEPGIGHCLIDAQDAGLKNLRVIKHDAIEVLQQQVGDAVLARITLFFPDPWPKKRHHKRRMVQISFLKLAASRLSPAGTLHIATDWENYAEHIDEVIAQSSEFTLAERCMHKGGFESLERQTTRFEKRGLRKGHSIWDWMLIRN
ncbi:MAG: tRNA (guanosine(46)-N7)-methyltransferase TrmB [Proteobacteria bacterium]|nr:tRNA (guanosine(46)-N7)-methyltransferase TrmB [Pseudomonadota bacterium]TDJ35928.1 MAG: tRNA (guanosine(46)-N7)-methyltransferase TrmB [Gammaproteobacteria bacterium]